MKLLPYPRHLWLLNILYKTNGLSRKEIDDKWRNCRWNGDKESSIPERTFHTWKDTIYIQWGIRIVYSRMTDKYSIDRDSIKNLDRFFDWMMRTISIAEMISKSRYLTDRILLEKMPSGEKWLTTVIDAMNENKILNMSYEPFGIGETHVMEFKPYFVKTFKQRWYIVGESSNHMGEIRVYSLDRVVDMDVSDQKFKMPKDLDGNELFKDLYGIWLGTDKPVETVRVLVTKNEANYLRTLPLHSSQKEIGPSKDNERIEFEWQIKVTYDFIMELRSKGKALKVIQPEWLKKEI